MGWDDRTVVLARIIRLRKDCKCRDAAMSAIWETGARVNATFFRLGRSDSAHFDSDAPRFKLDEVSGKNRSYQRRWTSSVNLRMSSFPLDSVGISDCPNRKIRRGTL